MQSPAAYLSEESASSNCPGTTAVNLSRRQSMMPGLNPAPLRLRAEETAFYLSNPAANPWFPPYKSLRNRRAESNNQAPLKTHGFCRLSHNQTGSSTPEVCHYTVHSHTIVSAGSMRITVAEKGQSAV